MDNTMTGADLVLELAGIGGKAEVSKVPVYDQSGRFLGLLTSAYEEDGLLCLDVDSNTEEP